MNPPPEVRCLRLIRGTPRIAPRRPGRCRTCKNTGLQATPDESIVVTYGLFRNQSSSAGIPNNHHRRRRPKPPYATLMRPAAVPKSNKGAASSHEKRPRWNRGRALEVTKSMQQSTLDDYQYSGECPWRNEEHLRELYIDHDLSRAQIADELGCSVTEVFKALKKWGFEKHPENLFLEARIRKGYTEELKSAANLAAEHGVSEHRVYAVLEKAGVETRGNSEAQRLKNLTEPATFYTCETRGYEYAIGVNRRNSAHPQEEVAIHRLVAVAEYGFDAVAGKQVHHINGVHWDNRPSNLEPLSQGEHVRRHFHDRPLKTAMAEASKEEIYHALEETGNLDVVDPNRSTEAV